MARSKWKGPNQKKKLLKKGIKKINNLYCRSAIILPIFLGKPVKIHNGHYFTKIVIKNCHLGHRFGEFGFSRKKYKYKK